MNQQELLAEDMGPILLLRLNRPEARNALSPSLLRSLGAALAQAEADPEVRAVVLTGTGDDVFCAGMDLRSFSEGESDIGDGDDTQALLRFFRGEIAVPIVAAANGTAVGGGLELLLGCDLIVLAEHARLGLPEVKRGFFAAGGGTFLGNRIPLSIALEMVLTGESIDAQRCVAIGLANAVVPSESVLGVALEYAERIGANAPLGVQASKELVRLGVVDTAAAWDRLGELQALVFGSDDAKEGALAFVEGREPTWTGR